MTVFTSLVENFVGQVRQEFPECLPFLRPMPSNCDVPDHYHEVLRVSSPPAPKGCELAVHFRGDSFEISFWVSNTRGPAEIEIVGDKSNISSIVADTLSWMRDFFSERIVVVIERFRFLWFQPYFLPFFEHVSEKPFSRRAREVISWKGNCNARLKT